MKGKSKSGKNLEIEMGKKGIVSITIAEKKYIATRQDMLTYVGNQPGVTTGDKYVSVRGGNIVLSPDTAREVQGLLDIIDRDRRDAQDNKISVTLSARGWGDYSNLEWDGDRRLDIDKIISECKDLLASAHDVDEREQTDEQIKNKIEKAIKKSYEPEPVYKEIDRGFGYCEKCGTYCYGDCEAN